MVKIAIVGGAGNVGREVIDVLLAAKKHEILVLSRSDAPSEEPGVTRVKADYTDPAQLAQVLQGVHTVLSFISPNNDPESMVQRNLIDAAVAAGVKRFAPSEWGPAGLDQTSWYAYKGETRRYLAELNKEKKVLEYTLFQVGWFLNYWTHPYKSSKYVSSTESQIDFANRRAIILEGSENDRMTVTTVQDIANVVARAIEFEGEWPVVGGIRGSSISVGELIALGEKIRGGTPFTIEKVTAQELETENLTTSWAPRFEHPSIPAEQVEFFSKIIHAGIAFAISAGAYNTSDEWNRLLPDYKFAQPEEFLAEAWKGK
ncbi:NAD(P)-binding protein, partial [Aspergillus ellipticus CBS 707.79]